jgi:hypothetical protein
VIDGQSEFQHPVVLKTVAGARNLGQVRVTNGMAIEVLSRLFDFG